MAFRLTSSDCDAERGSSSLRRISDSSPCSHTHTHTHTHTHIEVSDNVVASSLGTARSFISVYLRAVKRHAGKHRLGNARPLQLVPDLLVDAEGDFGPRAVEAGLAGGPEALAGARDGRVVEELLVDTLWVLVCQQVADGQLLVDEVGHGELLADELRRELRGQEPAVAQERGALGAQGGTRVVLAGWVRQTLRRGVPEATLDGQSSGAAQGAQMDGGG